MRRVVKRGDSFPFLAESSFRQLDDVFLQTQTRVWLGEVLKTRLDEETSIADLLADGILLFEVSKVIWKMLLTKFMKLRSSNAYFSKSASRKNSGRYMPYSNADSFLKICQILGLTGIDLFSPSDVVEKRDIRGVCMCIRSLSKKARSKDLNVPDFDVVTHTVAMPTDMVKGIRNSLELIQGRFYEDSAGCSKYPRPKYRKKIWGVDFARQYDSYSEESDNTDSNYQVVGFSSPASTTSCDGASLLNSDVENSPRGISVTVEDFHLPKCMFQTGRHDVEIDGRSDCSYSPSTEAEDSLNSYHLLNDDHQLTGTLPDGRLSPSGFDYPTELNAGTFCETKGAVRRALYTREDGMTRISPYLESCAALEKNSVDHGKSEQNIIGQPGASDSTGCDVDRDESAVFSGNTNDFICDLPRETDFHGSNSVYKTLICQCGRKSFEEMEDVEISSSAFSEYGKTDTTNYEDKYEGKDAFKNPIIQLPHHQNRVEYHIPVDRPMLRTDKLQFHINLEEVDSSKPLPTKECQSRIMSNECEGPEASEFHTPHSMSASYICEGPITVSTDDEGINCTYPAIYDLKVSGSSIKGASEEVKENLRNPSLSRDSSSTSIESPSEVLDATVTILATEDGKCSDHDTDTLTMVNEDDCVGHDTGGIVLDPCIKASDDHTCKLRTCLENEGREVQSDQHFSDENEPESAHLACTKNKEDAASSTENLNKGRDVGASDRKGYRKVLLKSFVGGMSVFGVFLLLFHLRKPNTRERINETSVPPIQIRKKNNGEVLRNNRERKRPDGVYPSEKLRF